MNKVGFIGLGIMGAPMSRNLMKAGYPVMVFNRSRGPMEAAARDGAEMAESLTQLAASCNVIFTMLPNSPQVKEVVLGEGGIASAAKPGTLIIDMTSGAPGDSKDIYAALKNKDIHIHFPEGAVPKDGPSAGITVTVALISALSGLPVRRDVAMTGEITLRGRVLPIGGLREKTMGALRAGVKTVIIPADNESDLENIDQTGRGKLCFLTAYNGDSIVELVFVRPAKKETPLQPSIPLQSQELCGTVRQ